MMKKQEAPSTNTRMTLDAPVPVVQERRPEPVSKQPMNVLVQDFAATVENHFNQFKEEAERIQNHGTRNLQFVITNEIAEKMEEICEKMGALNALMPNSVNIHRLDKGFN